MNEKLLVGGIVSFFALLLVTGTALGQESEPDYTIFGGWRYDSDAEEFVKNEGIVIKDGKFVSLTSSDAARRQPSLQVEDDHYILPGLIDLHAHYNVRLFRKRREEFHVIPIQYLANGATVTFSCGEYDPEGMMRLRKQIENGQQIGPRLINSGPYFGRARPGWRGEIDSDQIREEVDFWAERGVGGFKAKAISPRELKPLVEQAHKHGLTVTGHLGSGFRNSVNPRDAIEMGIDRVEHFLGGDGMPESESAYSSLARIRPDMPEFQEIVKIYVENEVYFDATITAYGYFGERGEQYDYWYDEKSLFTPFVQEAVAERDASRRIMRQFEEIFQVKQTTIDDYWKAGGLITMGTDHFSDGNYLAGFGVHREMDAFVRAGIPTRDVIKIATMNGAKALCIEDEHGSIEVGKSADLFIVQGNPIEDIHNTRNGKYVMTRGNIYKCDKLLDSVKGMLGPKDESEVKDW